MPLVVIIPDLWLFIIGTSALAVSIVISIIALRAIAGAKKVLSAAADGLFEPEGFTCDAETRPLAVVKAV